MRAIVRHENVEVKPGNYNFLKTRFTPLHILLLETNFDEYLKNNTDYELSGTY